MSHSKKKWDGLPLTAGFQADLEKMVYLLADWNGDQQFALVLIAAESSY